jgi:hypothetical protein
VNGRSIGASQSGPIAARPGDKLEVGNDSGSRVAEYGNATVWRGLIEDVRLYWGEPNVETLKA